VPPRREGPPDPLGKRALFGTPPHLGAEFGVAGVSTAPLREENGAIHSGAHVDHDEDDGGATSSISAAQRGTFVVECQRCSQGSSVGVLDLFRLQLPVGVWLPRGRFDRRMTCPVCRKRSWCSVTLRRG
jgi:hypothetical protein